MPVSVLYPKVSLEESRGRISRWLVAEGDAVAAGQVIFEIDNDKAAVEVEAPAAGTLRGLAPEGSLVDVGAEVARVLLPGETSAAETVSRSGEGPPAPASRAEPAPVTLNPGSRRPNPTPLARRLARESGIALDAMSGTGPRGRVQKKDVLARLAGNSFASATRTGEAGGLHAVWLRRGEGMPLVLLHGFGSDLNGWRGFLASAPAGPPVLVLDLPAHGRSPREVPEDTDAIASAVEDVLARHGASAGLLAAHSFGAAVAVRMARRGRADVRGLCLFAPAGLGPQIDGAFIDGILRARSRASLRPWLQMLVHDPGVISDAFVRVVEEQRADEGLTAAMRAFASRFMPDGTQAVSIVSDLPNLRIPVRVVFGRQDRILPFAATRALPANVALHAVDACGHMPHLEHPELSHRILGELVRSAL